MKKSEETILRHTSYRLIVTYFLAIFVCAFAMFFTLIHFEHLLSYVYMYVLDKSQPTNLVADVEQIRATVENNSRILYMTFIFSGLALIILALLGINLVRSMNQLVRKTEASQRAKQRFLTMMSHELRTPLTGLVGSSRLLKSTKLSEEQLHYVNQSIVAGDAMLELINNILDFSKSGSGDLEKRCVSISLRDVGKELEAIFSEPVKSKNNQLQITVSEAIPQCVYGDDVKLKQILLNLIGNAVKFTRDGLIQVEFQATENKDEIRISVADTGVGIEPKVVDRIFMPFFQAHEGDDRRYGGTGLGLAITKNLIESMGSEIRVESQAPKGTCFWFAIELPAAPSPVVAAAHDVPSVAAPPSRILVVEDDPISNDLISTMVRKMGHEVKAVSSGIAAMDYLRESEVDLVLLDCQMPEVSGFETSRRIRGMSGAGQVLIIGMSASIGQMERRQATSAGMDAFLAKPFTYEALHDTINMYLLKGVDRPIELATFVKLEEVDKREPQVFVERQVQMFGTIGRETLDEMRRAAQRDDLEEVSRLAHRFKSSCGLLGAMRLADLLEDIRQCEDKEHSLQVLDEIEEEFQSVRRYLAEMSGLAS